MVVVLLTADYDAKLCDFGLSQIRGRTGSTMKLSEHAKNAGAGTMAYMAPELLNLDTDASPQTDVYSFGILLVCLPHKGFHSLPMHCWWRHFT